MFPIAFITDEATQSIDVAIELAQEKELQGLELRSINDTPIDLIPETTLRSYAEKIAQAGLSVPCIAGSFYKVKLSTPGAQAEELQKLDRLIQAAQILGAPLIRGFAGLKEEEEVDDWGEWFRPVAKKLGKAGLKLCLEADPHVNTSNHKQIASLLASLDNSMFAAIYDPGNCLYDPLHERPYPEGYQALAGRIEHVHIKDVTFDADGQPMCLKVGDGDVPFPQILQALKNDDYQGWLSLETHYRKDIQLTDEQMLHPQGEAFSTGGMAAMRESIDSLRTLLDTLK